MLSNAVVVHVQLIVCSAFGSNAQMCFCRLFQHYRLYEVFLHGKRDEDTVDLNVRVLMCDLCSLLAVSFILFAFT